MPKLTLAVLAAATTAVAADKADPSMLFFSMGDWGGASDAEPTTAAELANGKGMQAVSDKIGMKPKFVMAVGDNFYYSGIQGDDHSKRFKETFEDAFPQKALDCPWHVVAGNHDHKGNVTAQIAYTGDSDRWNFPSYWYTFSETDANGVTTQVVYIDTVILGGMSYKDDETGEIVTGEPHPLQALADPQLEWLEGTLANSTADYLWVSGHYPVYSQCEHGPTEAIQSEVLPLMKKYKASGYIAGHDHCSGHYEADSMSFVVAGAGKECCYDPKNLDNKMNPGKPLFRMDSGNNPSKAKGGFASYEVSATATTIKYHDQDGAVLFTANPVAPRAHA